MSNRQPIFTFDEAVENRQRVGGAEAGVALSKYKDNVNQWYTTQKAREALERILNYCEEIDHHLPNEEKTGYHMFSDYLILQEYLLSQHRWLYCLFDGLPENEGKYLVYRPHFYAWNRGEYTICYFKDGNWTDNYYDFEPQYLQPEDVMKWKPLII